MKINDIFDIISHGENEQVEFKRLWKDEYLKTLCAFANTNGGLMFIGVEDDKAIVGVESTKNILETLPNKITNRIGIIAGVSIEKINNKSIIIVEIKKTYAPVSYRGKFFIRSGSVTSELRAGELTHFLLKKYGKTWDDIPVENFSIDEIDNKTIEKFKILAVDRIPTIIHEKNTEALLRKLNLYDGAYLKRAAILLFAKNPQKYFIQSHSKIGRFLTETDILTSDFIEGNLISQVDTILDVLRTKYLKSYISFEGIHRREKLEYPYEALKEAIINALIHRDYTNTSNLQIKVYDNKITMTNGALLPPEITVEKLKQSHASVPTNPIIAAVFYKAGLIENWGRGTINIVNDCINYKIPEPDFKFDMNIFWTTFYKNQKIIKSNKNDEGLNEGLNEGLSDGLNEGLNERQKKTLNLIIKKPGIQIKTLSKELNIPIDTLDRYIKIFVSKKIIERKGSKKTGGYFIKNTDK